MPQSHDLLKGILIHDNKVLLIRRNKKQKTFSGFWEAPGGKVDHVLIEGYPELKKEFHERALRREFEEETGITIITKKLIKAEEPFILEKSDGEHHYFKTTYLVKPIPAYSVQEQPELNLNKIKLQDEHDHFIWVSEKQLERFSETHPTLKMRDGDKKAIKAAFDALRKLRE